MKISENPYLKRLITKKIDENTFEVIDVYDISHPECPIVIIDSKREVVDEEQE